MPHFIQSLEYKDYKITAEQMYDLVLQTLDSLDFPIKTQKEDKIIALGPKELGMRTSKITISFYDTGIDIDGSCCGGYLSREDKECVEIFLKELKDIKNGVKKVAPKVKKKANHTIRNIFIFILILFFMPLLLPFCSFHSTSHYNIEKDLVLDIPSNPTAKDLVLDVPSNPTAAAYGFKTPEEHMFFCMGFTTAYGRRTKEITEHVENAAKIYSLLLQKREGIIAPKEMTPQHKEIYNKAIQLSMELFRTKDDATFIKIHDRCIEKDERWVNYLVRNGIKY